MSAQTAPSPPNVHRSASLPPSRLTEKLASRNGPRHSVYWVQRHPMTGSAATKKNKSRPSTSTSSNGTHIEYTVTGKYTGEWLDGRKHGFGTFVYANGSKYEGEWVQDQRNGCGTYWIQEHGKLRKQYAGHWYHDKRHGTGTFFYDDGGRYDGEWVYNQREGTGRMLYGRMDKEDQVDAVYDGQWLANERSGHGILRLANGNRYDGHWLHDVKEGPGRFYYHNTHNVYEGEWVHGQPQCGTYQHYTAQEQEQKQDHLFEIPEIGLCSPERIVNESIASIRQERILEKVFQTHFKEPVSTHDDEKEEEASHSVVFDEETMRHLQQEFEAIGPVHSTIQCHQLLPLIDALNLSIQTHAIDSFLEEIGATSSTAISFAECVDILSLLVESQEEEQGEEEE